MERAENIMFNATAELNRKAEGDIYIPIRASEYRELIERAAYLKADLKLAEKESSHYCSEAYLKSRRIDELTAEVADLKKKLEEVLR